MDAQRKGRDVGLAALLISPNREIAVEFGMTLPETRTFQILAELNTYPSQRELEIRLRQIQPEMVLIDCATGLDTAVDLIRFLASYQVQVVALHRSNDSASVVKVLRAGAADFLYSPFEAGAQREAAARLRRLRSPEQEAEHELGKVVLFTSAKPGAGSSTLATHVAHGLRKTTGKRVLLIDFDLEGGTIGFYLKLQPESSVVEALEQVGSLDAASWSALTVNSGGIDVLTAPEQPYSQSPDHARVHDLLSYARMLYDWVIVDAPTVFHRTSLTILTECEQAFLISSSDLASLHLARKAVGLLTQIGLSKERYQVVVNRLSKRDGIAGSDIEKIFNCTVFASLPNDYFSLHRVISLGQPLAADCELGKAILAMATKLCGPPNPPKQAAALTEAKPALSQT
ncbi:MAG: AAA family ATPase [Bryobacteraceae bacterium]